MVRELWKYIKRRCVDNQIDWYHLDPKEWSEPGKLAKALQIGRLESEAAVNLMVNVPATVLVELEKAVRVRGQRAFVTHDTIAKNLFSSYGEGWQEFCTNCQDNRLEAGRHLEHCLDKKLLVQTIIVWTAVQMT